MSGPAGRRSVGRARSAPRAMLRGEARPPGEKANGRLEMLVEAGAEGARLYGANEEEYGTGAFFLPLDDPEVVSRRYGSLWGSAAIAAGALVAGVAASFLEGHRRPTHKVADAWPSHR